MTDPRSSHRAALSAQRTHERGHGLTLAACALVASTSLGALWHLTAGFEDWTFEARRRHDAARGQLYFPSMQLIDSSGQAWQHPAGGTGNVMVVAFFYANCASVCQALGAELYRAQQSIQKVGSGVRLLSVSIDPARDTPAALAAYARLHHADASVWRIGAPASVEAGQRARRALRVIAIDDGQGGFVHNGDLHVVDAQGRVAGIFDLADWERALVLANDLDKARP